MTSPITNVYPDGMCTGCGTCVGICPKQAVEFVCDEQKGLLRPVVSSACNGCGLCGQVCPAYAWGEDSSDTPDEKLMSVELGTFKSCYSGYSCNDDLRIQCSSGGFVTQFLTTLFEKGVINAALVTRRSRVAPLQSEPFLAYAKEDLLKASGSKYCPVGLNSILSDVLRTQTPMKIAVVGLPCHIKGIALATRHIPALKQKIAVTVALFCGHTPSYCATDYALEKLNISKKDVVMFSNRGNGWPGYLSINLKNGSVTQLPYKGIYSWGAILGSLLFSPFSCQMCPDPTGESADVSTGDAWLKEFANDKKGTNLIISRNIDSDVLLRVCQQAGGIHLEYIDPERVVHSHKNVILTKKKNLLGRVLLFRILTQKKQYLNGCKYLKADAFVFAKAFILLPILLFLKRCNIVKLMKHTPLRVILFLRYINFLK